MLRAIVAPIRAFDRSITRRRLWLSQVRQPVALHSAARMSLDKADSLPDRSLSGDHCGDLPGPCPKPRIPHGYTAIPVPLAFDVRVSR